MGWAARANPASLDGKDERAKLELVLRRFVCTFRTRQAFEEYCRVARATDAERIYLETLLPPHLRVDAAEDTH